MVFALRKLFAARSLAVLGVAPLVLTLAAGPDSSLGQQTQPVRAQAQPTLTPQQQQYAEKVQNLINRAQASYTSGVNNYNNNRLDAARQDFDAAVDMMLSSGMDLKNDPQLSDAFEHLLDSINSLEIVALKQGNGFSPKLEEAPIEEADTEVTFKPDPALVSRIANQLKTTKSDLPLTVNDYVAGFISYYTNSSTGHAHLLRSLERAGKYKEMISRILAQYGVPQDLIYLAVAESGFQPQVLNRQSGAGGMWQFMPFAGAYGLERNGYFDERFDPEKSTIAYAKYMRSLHDQFGDWYLAMAAYDWGPGYVQRAVSRTGYADFWELYRHNALPAETKNYVPAILAAAIMAKNPQQYGLTGLVPDAPVLSDTVTVDYAIDLKLVADLTSASVPEIVALNPALLRLTTPGDIPYDLHLPPGTKDTFTTRLKDIPAEDRASWRFHVVAAGETLNGIASSFHADPAAVATYNDVSDAKPIEVGDELVIPISAGVRQAQQRYKVRRGDTLVTVADRFGVSVEQLREWNGVAGAHLTPGRTIYVAEPVRLAPSSRRGRPHVSRTASGREHAGAHHAQADPPTHSAKRGGHAAQHATQHAATSHATKHANSTSAHKHRR